MIFDEEAPPPGEPLRRRLAGFGLAALVTALLLGLALRLGDWAYGQRRLSMHESRLQRALDQQPLLDALTQGLAAEPGVALLATPEPRRELVRLLAGRDAAQRSAVLERAERAPALRLFRVEEDLLYVAFGDAGGRFTGFAIVEVEAAAGRAR